VSSFRRQRDVSVETIVLAKLVLLLVPMFLVVQRRSRFRGTTLVAPLVWAILALLLIAGIDLSLSLSKVNLTTVEKARYFAATSSFCPLMAVLGAKRPQDKGWQWIVLSLWIVLILPVAQTFIWRGGALEIGPFRRWFSVILMFVGLANYALTRFGFAAIVFTAGQGCLLLPQLPVVGRAYQDADRWPPIWALGLVLVAASIGIAYWQTRREPKRENWNRVWIDFRNAYGLVWGLRVMERINTTSKLCNWGTELGWFGFDKLDATETDANELERTVQTVLRRFVSPEWIAMRRES